MTERLRLRCETEYRPDLLKGRGKMGESLLLVVRGAECGIALTTLW